MENDAPEGSESLTLDQAAAAYAKATAPAVETDHAEHEAEAPSDDTTDEELQAEESAGEEDDGEPAEEDQAEEDDEEPQSEQGRFVADNARVKLPDGTFTTVAELKQGSLRNADYTRKTQEVSEQRKAVESQSERLTASEKQLEQMREYNISPIKSIIPPEPDPTKADPRSPNYDPAGYQAEEVAYKQWAQHLAYLESQQTQAQQERAKKATETEKETADKEWATLVEKLPHLKDAKRVDPFVTDLRKYATETYGFKPEEMKAIALDHRLALALNDAIKWNKLQASKATVQKKVEGRPPVQKGGKRLNPSEHRARAASDATNRLKETGRLDDAVTAYLATQQK
jgi:hypothetical protein